MASRIFLHMPAFRNVVAAIPVATTVVVAEAVVADFILDSTGLDASLSLDAQFDLVIENPPYGKLAASSTHRTAMRAAGVDTPNLYAAFLALSVAALRPGGQVVAITPRSFFNGPYFGGFRSHLLDSIALDGLPAVAPAGHVTINDLRDLAEAVLVVHSLHE